MWICLAYILRNIVLPLLLLFILVFSFQALQGCSPTDNDTSPDNSSKYFYAGFRASRYGIEPFPGPEYWAGVGNQMVSRFNNARPCGIWIVGEIIDEGTCLLNFPPNGNKFPNVDFGDEDQNEAYLSLFDAQGVSLWLQVEPGNADVMLLMDLVLGRYAHHPCVIGFGVDVEWLKISSYPEGKAVTDIEALKWCKRVQDCKSSYMLFLKHWLIEKMPAQLPENLFLINDSNGFSSLAEMVSEFDEWGEQFSPNPVGFQIGYDEDKIWWSAMDDPAGQIGNAIIATIGNTKGIFWVDFTIKKVFPEKRIKQLNRAGGKANFNHFSSL